MTTTTFLQQHRKLWVHPDFVSSAFFGSLVLICGFLSTLAAQMLLSRSVAAIGASPDLLLDLLPVTSVENFLVWGVPLLIGIIGTLFLLYPERIPFCLKCIGLLFLIRSFFVLLTPMGMRTDQAILSPNGFLQHLAYGSNDFFFSGHTALPMLIALVYWDKRSARLLLLALSACFGLAVLLAHTHYSVDVFAVPFIVPSIFGLSKYLFAQDAIPEASDEPAHTFGLASARTLPRV